jgi:tetratricopeptide (TPR) repeat protein
MARVALIALALTFATRAALAFPGGRQNDAAQHRELGLAALKNGRIDDAIVELREAVRLGPDDAATHDALGVALGEGGQLDAAESAFRRAASLAPDAADIRFHLALALERLGRPAEALIEYQHALASDPAQLEAYYGLGSVCAQLGDLDGAVAALQRVVDALPEMAEAHFNLGVNLSNRYRSTTGPRHQPDIERALAELQRAVQLAPSDPRALVALGQLQAERQNHAEAVASLRKAQALQPDNAEIAYDLGLALRLAGDLDGAAVALRSAIDRGHRVAEARRALGLVLRQKGDLEGAVTELRAVVAAERNDPEAQHLLGVTLLKLSQPEDGIAALKLAVAFDPDLTEAHVALAQALARSGQTEAARAQQAEVQRINQESSSVGHAMILVDNAATETADGQRARAITDLREAIAISPRFAEAHERLGELLLVDPAQTDEAEAALSRATDLEPRRAKAHYLRGVARERRGDPDGAGSEYQTAVTLAPSLIDAQRALAELASRTQRWAVAAGAWTAVLAWSPGDSRARAGLVQATRARTQQMPPP